ncbi:MAG: GGDEF domain-containing protein [Nitrosomonadales bacterium]
MLAAAHRDKQKFALMFIDLDRFKYVNDSMGHSMGDRLLQKVAQRVLECVREGDTVSRIGGDEFIVLLRETDEGGAANVAEKILNSLAVTCDIGDTQISTNASIGVSIYPDHANDVDTLIKMPMWRCTMPRAKDVTTSSFLRQT